jgi:hypothetical protein
VLLPEICKVEKLKQVVHWGLITLAEAFTVTPKFPARPGGNSYQLQPYQAEGSVDFQLDLRRIHITQVVQVDLDL